MRNTNLFTSSNRIEIDHISNSLNPSISTSEKELFSKYFKRHFVYLEPFFNLGYGFYTILEIRNRLICVFGESKSCKIDRGNSWHTLRNMIRHKVIQFDTDYVKAVNSIYNELDFINQQGNSGKKIAMNIGLISINKISGYLDFVGNGFMLNYYQKNISQPKVYNPDTTQNQLKELHLHQIETQKGDRFFLQNCPVDQQIKTQEKFFMNKVVSMFNKAWLKNEPTQQRVGDKAMNIKASLMLAFTF